MSEQVDVAAIAELLADDTARRILLETRTEPMDADALSERCDVSPSTVYRRIDQLREHDLLVERTQPDADGHHYQVYAARLERVAVDVTDDGFEVSLDRAEPDDRTEEGPADRFTRLVEGM